MATAADIALFSLFSFVGNAGVALTGFGHAIIFIFVWQIAVLAGYHSSFTYAVFIQALSLLAAQPLLVFKAQIHKFAPKRMLLYFIPVTILSTPLGQYTGQNVGTEVVELVAGGLVTFVACFEIFQRRLLFWKWARHIARTITCGKVCPKSGNARDTEQGACSPDDQNSALSAPSSQEAIIAIDGSGDDDSWGVAEGPLPLPAMFWTLSAGFASGFLGGLCGIRGPPIILYFLHPPYPVRFPNKKVQKATGAAITLTNVVMRVVYYLINTLAFNKTSFFTLSDWGVYVGTGAFSIFGAFIGGKLFERLKDNQVTIKGILTLFLLLCGVSLLISSLAAGL